MYGSTPTLSSYDSYLDEVADDAQGLVEDTVGEATERGIDWTTSVLRGVPHEVNLEDAN